MRLGETDEVRKPDMKSFVNTRENVRLGAVGLASGILSGLLGISSGVVIVPALVMVLDWNQKLAQGTALAVSLPPLGIFAVMDYYHDGYVRLFPAALMSLGLLAGGSFGGKLAGKIHQDRLRRLFAAMLFLIGLKMLLGV
jgi:uncharacterized protein